MAQQTRPEVCTAQELSISHDLHVCSSCFDGLGAAAQVRAAITAYPRQRSSHLKTETDGRGHELLSFDRFLIQRRVSPLKHAFMVHLRRRTSITLQTEREDANGSEGADAIGLLRLKEPLPP